MRYAGSFVAFIHGDHGASAGTAPVALFKDLCVQICRFHSFSCGKPRWPDWIGGRGVAGGVQSLDLLKSQRPADGADIGDELLFIAGADDNAGDAFALQEPFSAT